MIALRGSILGVGTDVGGSIRIPAACNNLFGVKPSHGRVPYAGQEGGKKPGSSKLDIGAGDVSIKEQYIKNGWRNYVKAYSGSNSRENKMAIAEEQRKWWK